jgi:hypothetical protein
VELFFDGFAEGAVGGGPEGGNLNDRWDRDRPVNVGKLLLPAIEVLVAHFSTEEPRIDVKEHEILPSTKSLIGNPGDLISIGTVNEPVSHQRVRRV